MQHIKKFNEIVSKNEILIEICKELITKGNLSNLYFSNNLNPTVYFIYNNIPYTISLIDKIGNEYSTISVIYEEDVITNLFGYYNINEIDKIVKLISNYRI